MAHEHKKSPWRFALPLLGGIGVTFASVATYTAFTAAGFPPIDAAFNTAAAGLETIVDSVATIGGAGVEFLEREIG